MFRKNYFTVFFTIALLLAGSIAAFAQAAPVSGRVEIKKADGTSEPAVGATVEVYRIDVKGKLPSGKTNKKGEFSFAGFPLGGVFVLSVSGPGIAPTYLPNVKAGAEKIVITTSPGDGKKWTEEEVRAALASPAQTSTEATNTKAELTPDQKKQMEERAKLEADYAAKKEKVENENAIIQASVKAGNEAYNAKNYDLAITEYEKGIQANPTFIGSAPALLNNKGFALTKRAIDLYNNAAKSTDTAMKTDAAAKVKQDLTNSVAMFNQSLSILTSATAADIPNQEAYSKNKYDALLGLIDSHRLMVQTKADMSKSADAKIAYDKYLAVETDPAKKAKAEINLGDIFLGGGDSQGAIEAYKAALAITPDNPDALAGLGLSQANAGYNADGSVNDAMMQEAINNLQRFTDIAPENHKLKSSVKETVDYLKTQNFKPQKTTGGKKKN